MTTTTISQYGETFHRHPVWTHLLVSDMGRVWSDKSNRFIGFKSGPQGGRRNGRNDYLRVTVAKRRPGDVKVAVAALVLETFVGPRPEDHDADHINHLSTDNRLSNLRWRVVGENRADTKRETSSTTADPTRKAK